VVVNRAASKLAGEGRLFLAVFRVSPKAVGLEQEDLRKAMHEAISSLSAREAKVIRLRYGLDDGVIRSLRAVGATLNLSGEWIRQIEMTALLKLRHLL